MTEIQRLTDFLNLRYPVNDEHGLRNWARIAFIVCMTVFLVLFLFRPFGLSNYHGPVLEVCICFCLVSFFTTLLYRFIAFKPIFGRVKTWRVWHQGVLLFFLIVVISLANVAAHALFFGVPPSLKLLAGYLVATFSIALIIVPITIFMSYNQMLRNRLDMLINKDSDIQQGRTVTLHDDAVKTNDLVIDAADFIYAEVRKNNIKVYYLKSGELATRELRTTMTALVSSIDIQNIIQCHRSFVINVNHITQAKGNSNGYKLKLDKCTDVIPVSRTYVPLLKSFIA